MKKNMRKITCLFVFVLFSGLAIASEPIKSDELRKIKTIPGVVSLLLDEVISPVALFPFPDTGQDKCYGNEGIIDCPTDPGDAFYGQDAQYPRIQRSYTKLGEDGEELEYDVEHTDHGGKWSMTRDDITGLTWEIKTNANKDDTYTWQNANDEFIAALNSEEFGGFSDWRLPSRAELSSLSDRGKHSPAIRMEKSPKVDQSTPFWFPNTNPSRYWTSTPLANNSDNMWRVNFWIGFAYYEDKDNFKYHVRGVRGPAIEKQMVDNNDGTVTDKATGLIWKKCSYGQDWDETTENCTGTAELLTWKDALASAAEDNEWRLPNINELQSLVDDSVYNPAIYEPFRSYLPPALDSPDPDHTYSLPYWSSTTTIDPRYEDYDRAWLINFVDGSNNYDGYDGTQGEKTREFYVRLVRTLK